MNSRSLLVGLLSGMIAAALLAVPLLMWLPATYVGDMPQLPSALAILASLGAAFSMIVAAGVGGAWAGGPQRRQQVLQGTYIGMIAGLIAWLALGPTSAGIAGNAPIWNHGLRPVSSEGTLALLLIESVAQTTYWHYGLFWYMLLAGVMLGLLGGYIGSKTSVLPAHPPRPLPLMVWKMLAINVLMLLTALTFAMPEIYYLLKNKCIENLQTYHLTTNLPLRPILDYPDGMIYLALIVTTRWAWYLVALDRAYGGGRVRGTTFRLMAALLPLLSAGISLLVRPNQVELLLDQLGWVGVGVSLLVGLVHTLWGPPPQIGSHPDSPMHWYDWPAGLLISAIVCAALIQLIATGIPMSLVLVTLIPVEIFIAPTESSQTAASIIADLMYIQQQNSLLSGWIVPVLMLPIFGIYIWIRGGRRRGETAL